MPTNTDLVLKRIRNIRKSKHLRMKDCAKALGVSKDSYRSFEEGSKPISIPELELLAFYLGVSPTALVENEQGTTPFAKVLQEDIRPQYISIRRKMIAALISAARGKKAISLEELQQATRITTEDLDAYEQGDIPIPLTELFLISDYLEFSHKALFSAVTKADSDHESQNLEGSWDLDFSKGSHEPADDELMDLLHALRHLSKKDQAEIAKIILEKLRS